jgi:hypothetical protein
LRALSVINGTRARMRGCNQFCGISHSVRRETSTLASRRPAVAFPADPPAPPVARWAAPYRFC